MPPDYALMSLGSPDAFRPAGSCPVASGWSRGEYMPHQGDADSFLVADARTADGTAAVRLAAWRCVHCGALLAGVARADGDPGAAQQFAWLEEQVVRIGTAAPARAASGRERGPGDQLQEATPCG